MSAITKKYDAYALRMDEVTVELHALYGNSASVAIGFRDPRSVCGLKSGFHMSTSEARELAAKLVKYADVAESCKAMLDEVAE